MKKLLLSLIILFSFSSAYAQENISYENAIETSNQNVLILIGTDWCGGCLKLKKELSSLNTEHYLICNIDAEKRKDLAEKYSVKAYPTSIIIKNNEVVSKKVGFNKKEYSKWLEENRFIPKKSCCCDKNCNCGIDCKCDSSCSCKNHNLKKQMSQKICDCGCVGGCNCGYFCTCGCAWSWLFGK